ncbi:unnamed protein product [Gadus morhua 'NCC']
MQALGGMLVVVVLLVRTQCEVRARDPGEEGGVGGGAGGGGGGAGGGAGGGGGGAGGGGGGAGGWEQKELLLEDLLTGPETTRPPGSEPQRPPGTIASRTGNWCAFVQQRVVPTTVKCETEKYTIRTPCPPETPNCQLVMVQAPSRPVYRQQQHVFTALQWRCCPGHNGPHCRDADEQNDTQSPAPQHDPRNPQLHHGNQDPRDPQLHHGNHDPRDPKLHHGNHDPRNPELHHGSHDPRNPELHHGNHHHTNGAHSSDLQNEAALVPAVAALVLAQLNPVLEGFNRSLLLLERRMGELAQELAPRSPEGEREPARDQAPRPGAGSRLEEVQEVRQLLDSHRNAVYEQLNSQHATLQANLGSLRTEVNLKLQRSEEMIQTSIQGLNASLVDLCGPHGLGEGARCQEQGGGARGQEPSPSPAKEPAWTKHLNTQVKLSALEEDVKDDRRSLGALRRRLGELEEQISQTGRESQMKFMETGLDVEAAREVVLGQLRELEGNLSSAAQQAQDRDNDVDYLFKVLYNCTALRHEVARLERGVANLTQLVDVKQPAPEEGAQWASPVKELQLGLQQLQDALVLERGAGDLEERMRRLSSSFGSLLKDAGRNSEVLEVLLGEDVLEFLRRPPAYQEALSIPGLKEQIRSLNHSLTALHRDRAESLMADQPLPAEGGVRSSSHAPLREQQILTAPDPADRGGALEKEVEELEVRVQALEEQGGGAQEEQLQQEVLWLRRAVEDHLRLFKKVFRQAETLEDSHRTLDLQDLWTLSQDPRRERRRGGERRGEKDGEVRREALQGRRDPKATAPRPQSSPLLLAAGLLGNGRFLGFKASLNVGGDYSETSGRFTAPQTGLYLLLLTLDLRPGHTHLLLRRRSGTELHLLQEEVKEGAGALSFLRLLHLEEKEWLSVELRAGGLLDPSSTALAVLLLH